MNRRSPASSCATADSTRARHARLSNRGRVTIAPTNSRALTVIGEPQAILVSTPPGHADDGESLTQMDTQTNQTPSTASPTRRVFQRLDTTSKAPYPRAWYARKLLWFFVWHLLYRPTPRAMRSFRVFLIRLFGGKVPYSVNLLPSSRVWHPWLLTMGEYGCLADGVMVYNLGPVSIGAHTVLSQDAYICAGTHDYTQPNLPLLRPPITIGAGVWVCTRAFIGPGVTVGDNAIVGACAVVTRSVPPDVIVQGNPAEVLKPRRMDDGALG